MVVHEGGGGGSYIAENYALQRACLGSEYGIFESVQDCLADQRPGNSGGVSRGEAVAIVLFTDSLPNLDKLGRVAPGANVKLLRWMVDSLLQLLLRLMRRSGTQLDFPHCHSQ